MALGGRSYSDLMEKRSGIVINALLQSMRLVTDATELGLSGAMEFPFEALASL
jgi:hypothetical protein